MLHDRRSALSGYVSGLLSEGRTVFTAEEAEQSLGVGPGAFLDAAERLQRGEAFGTFPGGSASDHDDRSSVAIDSTHVRCAA